MPLRRLTLVAGLLASLGCLSVALPSWSADALVISTDFATGYYSRLGLASPWPHTNNVQSTCSDAAARAQDGFIYILGRFGCDFVQVVDGTTFATLRQFSTGNGSNPQDIEVVTPSKAFVSLYDRDALLIVDPTTGLATGSVDLSMFSDADGLPETAEMARVGNRLFVCLQRLDRPGGFVAANPSFIAVVDVTTNQLIDANPALPGVQAIALTGRNPFSELRLDPVRQKLYVAEVGDFGPLDGGVEFIDPVTLQAEGFFITEATLGGDLNAVRLWTDCSGYAIVNDSSFRTKLVRFDRCNGTALGTCWQSTGYDLCDVEIDYARAQVLVSDRDLVHPGIRIFRAGTGSCAALTGNPIDFGLPPCDIALMEPVSPTDAAPAVTNRLRLSPNWPDPFNPTTTMRIEAPAGVAARLEIADVRGRRVRLLWNGMVPAAGQDVVWDGRDAAGVTLPSGVYFAHCTTNGETRIERLTMVR